ncbi:MAG TPA: choice-of-anchor P family protein [Nocardioides sp.]|nr:choice-of-anchor P family protein [Nocardioides sp.]
MPRPSSSLAGAAVVAAGLFLTALPAASAAPGATTGTPRPTHDALAASGFGSRVIGGQVPAGSGTTAYQVIGCTASPGVVRTNTLATADVTGLGTLTDLRTKVWTSRHHGVVAAHARHRIAALTLVDSPLGSVTVTGIVTKVRAFHDSTGFHAEQSSRVGAITFTPPVGPAQSLPAPTPGNPVTVPGLVTLTAGSSSVATSATGAAVDANALKVKVIPTSTEVKLAHGSATIGGGVEYGLFHGHSDASRVSAVSDVLRSGPTPLTVMPCQGTGGEVHRKSVAHLGLGGQIALRGLVSRDSSSQTRRRAHGYERSRVGRINLGGGAVVVDGIVGQATVTRTRHHTVCTAQGTHVGTVTANGQELTFPKSGVIEIPGVAKLRRHLVARSGTGLSVTALRIKLLDGTGAVIDLGQATLHISHLRR